MHDVICPDHLITKEMCNNIMRTMPDAFHRISDRFKTQSMCNEAVEIGPWHLKDVSDHYKTQEMCDKAVRDYLFSFRFVPDRFVTEQQKDIWYDQYYVYNDNGMIKWYDGYKKKKGSKSTN